MRLQGSSSADTVVARGSTTGARIVESLAEHAVAGPALAIALEVLHRSGELHPDLARGLVARAFDSCPHPSSVLDVDDWIAMFRLAGFTREWLPAPLPTASLRVYRGAAVGRFDGLSWSTRLEVAQEFAAKRPGGVVATAVVGPERQLAELAVGWEDQVVVDTRGLALEIIPRGAGGGFA